MRELQDNILGCVGETPLIRLQRLVPAGAAQVLVKLEMLNVSGSAKIRSALAMVEQAEAAGHLHPGSVIVEASSGNGGVGMAAVGAVKGYPVIIVMPDNASIERQQLIRAYGGQVILTPQTQRVAGAIARVEELKAANPNIFYPGSMSNPANPGGHYRTGQEILSQYPGPIDAWVAGAGSGGSLSGIGRALKESHPGLQVYVASPAAQPSLVAGVGQYNPAGTSPATLDRSLVDGAIAVADADSVATTRALASQEGILAGPSSGMVVWAAIELAKELGPGHTVVTVLMDTGERYLSTGLFA